MKMEVYFYLYGQLVSFYYNSQQFRAVERHKYDNDIYTLKLMKFFYKLSNDSLPAYFASYKTLIQP